MQKLLVFLALGLVGAGCAPSLPSPQAERFVLRGVELVEPARSRRHDVDLAVAEGSIQAQAEGIPVLDAYAGMFVLPGLMDLHAHLPPDTPLRLTEYFGLLFLAHGVTSLREAGDLDGTAVPAARAAAQAGAPMPRIHSCGPFVGGARHRWSNWEELERPEDAPALAARLRAAGNVCVKVYDGLDAPRVHALVEAARAEGLVPIGHVPFGLTLEQARVPDTQHLMGVARPEDIAAGDHVVHRIMDWHAVDDARLDEVVAASVALGLAHTPTLATSHALLAYADYPRAVDAPEYRVMPGMYRAVVWSPSEGIGAYRGFGPDEIALLRDAWPKKLELVRRLHEAGVPLHLGTDTQQPWVVPGASLWDELHHFTEAGIPLEEALADATWRGADGVGDPALGGLAPGAPADLLVFREDPTRDLDALDSLEAVAVRGRLYRRADLERSVEEWRAWYANPLVDFVARTVARRRLKAAVLSDH